MTDPADTVREALNRPMAMYDEEVHAAGLAALAELEAQLAERTEALIAMVYVHPCQCGDGIPQGACARCRAVSNLGFEPAALAGREES